MCIRDRITAVLQDFGAERSEVVGDEVIALDAAFQGGPGILQIAGTGSNTIGRAPDGSREWAGGYSSRLGDEGDVYKRQGGKAADVGLEGPFDLGDGVHAADGCLLYTSRCV